MNNNESAVVVTDLFKSFKKNDVLKGVTFFVKKGSIFALLGSNGAGKTTIIKILTTLLKSDGGNASVLGFDVAKEAHDVRSNISLTGQNVSLDHILTGRENLVMIGNLRRLSNPQRESDRLLKEFDLVEHADKKVLEYSGGMQRKLDLAMGLMGSPKVVFLDEPTVGLDPEARLTMWNTIKNLKELGITIFLTTQYLEEAEKLADDIAILHHGKIVLNGSPSELKDMFPDEKIEFRFESEESFNKAVNILSSYSIEKDLKSLKFTVKTNGSIKDLTDLFNKFNESNLDIAEFTQIKPTVEDVFMSIVSKEKGNV